MLSAAAISPPKFRTEWIEPPALHRGLDVLRAYHFVLITALPGSGKSRYMARLANEAQAALDVTAWLRCAAWTGSTLANNIATSLVRSVLSESSATAALLIADALPPSVMMTVCLNEVAAFVGNVVLFLDDVGVLADPEALEILQRLIEEAPGNLRIVMASRSTVRLKIARLENDGTLLQLGNRALQLGSDQIANLVVGLGQPRPELAELRRLSEHTQGWVGGLRLLTRRDFGRQAGKAGAAINPAVLAYFEEEVLAGLSDKARGVLDTILLPHVLREELIVDLAGDADIRDHLLELQRYCLIEPQQDEAGVWYRAAPLLTDAAKHLRLIGAEEIRSLHRRCSDWFERHGYSQAAAAHAIDAGDIQRAIQLIDQCGMTMIANGHVTALQQWMANLPLDQLRQRPWALLSVAWAVSLLYRLDEALPLIEAVEEDLPAFGSDADTALEASVAAIRVMHLSMRDEVWQACQAARAWIARFGRRGDWPSYVVDNSLSFALARLGHVHEARLVLERAYLPNFYARGPYAAIYSRCILGLIDMRDGQVRRAETNFAWALKAAETVADINSTGAVMAAGLLASTRQERNDQLGAQRLLDGYAWWMHAHLFTDARFHAYRAIARDQTRRHQYRAAISTLEQVLDSGPSVRLVRLHADVLIEKIQVVLVQHDLRMANTYIRALADQQRGIAHDVLLYDYVEAGMLGSQAHLDLAMGSWDEAITLLRRAIRMDLRAGWKLRAFHWAVLLARALSRAGRGGSAVRLMYRLVGYSARGGIVSTILDGGADIAHLLDRVAAQAEGMDPRTEMHLRRLREAFDPGLIEKEDAAVDPAAARDGLTAREIDLIRLVKGGLTNRQIAARMQVSENTIKWHLKNIFEKVSVKKRAELTGLPLPLPLSHGGGGPPARPPARRVVSRPGPMTKLTSAMRDP